MVHNIDNIKAKVKKVDTINANVSNAIQRVTYETEEITVTPKTEEQIIKPTKGKLINKVTAEPVTAAIDSDIQAENIREGINILGVNGSYSGIDTSDATATATDLLKDKTAYVKGEKITGTLEILDTSDATATAYDIINPKTAYVNGEKITGQVIPSYNIAASTLNSPYNITNSTGYKIVDISLQYGFCLLTSVIPTTEYIIGKIGTGDKIEVTDKKITIANLGLSGAKIVDSSIGKLLNSDGTLTIGMSVEKSGNFAYFVNIDPTTFEVKKHVHNSTSFLGIQSELDNKFVVEINPKDPTVLLLSAYYIYGFKTWIAVSEGNSVTVTLVRSVEVYSSEIGYVAWKPDGTAYRVHGHDGETSQIFTFNLKTKTSSYKGTLTRNCCFYKDDYVLTNEGEMYNINNLSTKVRTLSGLSLTSDYSSRALNSNIMYCIDNFVLMHGLWDFFKIFYINPDTFAVTTRYSNTYSMSNSAELKRTVCWGSLESNTLSVVPMSATTVNRVMKITTEETIKALSVNGEILMNTESGNATAANILTGKIAFAANNKIVGTMPNRGTRTYTPTTTNITIPAGYHNGNGYVVGDVNLIPQNIKSGVTIFGVEGVLEGVGSTINILNITSGNFSIEGNTLVIEEASE